MLLRAFDDAARFFTFTDISRCRLPCRPSFSLSSFRYRFQGRSAFERRTLRAFSKFRFHARLHISPASFPPPEHFRAQFSASSVIFFRLSPPLDSRADIEAIQSSAAAATLV